MKAPKNAILAASVITAAALGFMRADVWSAGRSTVERREGKQMIEVQSFKPLPNDLKVRLRVLPREQQRYDTEGDWLWSGDTLEIRLSREAGDDDPRYTILLLTHELIEALLCRSAGITQAQVDAFDMSYQGEDEPGDDAAAPYHRQHVAAEAAERALARQLGVDWNEYIGE